MRRLPSQLRPQLIRGTRDLHAPLVDVDRHADRRGLVRDRPLACLADPPGGIGRELVAATPVELLDRAVQPQRPLLDQVEERHAEPAVPLRDRHDEPEVRLDHAPLRATVAALDRLREDDLLVGGQKLVLADVGEEELQAVARARGCVRLVDHGLGLRLRVLLLDDRLVLGVGQRAAVDAAPSHRRPVGLRHQADTRSGRRDAAADGGIIFASGA